jgi:hypothetical protein
LIIPKLILGANICIAAFGAVTLFREIRKLWAEYKIETQLIQKYML